MTDAHATNCNEKYDCFRFHEIPSEPGKENFSSFSETAIGGGRLQFRLRGGIPPLTYDQNLCADRHFARTLRIDFLRGPRCGPVLNVLPGHAPEDLLQSRQQPYSV